jgi:hypothetical protein
MDVDASYLVVIDMRALQEFLLELPHSVEGARLNVDTIDRDETCALYLPNAENYSNWFTGFSRTRPLGSSFAWRGKTATTRERINPVP